MCQWLIWPLFACNVATTVVTSLCCVCKTQKIEWDEALLFARNTRLLSTTRERYWCTYPWTEIPHCKVKVIALWTPSRNRLPPDSYTIWISTEALHIPIVCSYLPWNMAWFSVQLRTDRFSCRLYKSTYKKCHSQPDHINMYSDTIDRLDMEKLARTSLLLQSSNVWHDMRVCKTENRSFVPNTTGGGVLEGVDVCKACIISR